MVSKTLAIKKRSKPFARTKCWPGQLTTLTQLAKTCLVNIQHTGNNWPSPTCKLIILPQTSYESKCIPRVKGYTKSQSYYPLLTMD